MSKKDYVEYNTAAPSEIKQSDDLWNMLSNFVSNVNYKLIFLLFVLFIFITSDVFTDRVLKKFSYTFEPNKMMSNWGVVLQGIFLVIGYLLLDIIVKLDIV